MRYGRPVPSFFRIDKAMLAELVEAARDERTAAMAAWAVRTRARLERIRTIRMVRGRRKQESGPDSARAGARGGAGVRVENESLESCGFVHAALAAGPSPRRGDPAGLRPPVDNSSTAPPAVFPRPGTVCSPPLPEGLMVMLVELSRYVMV